MSATASGGAKRSNPAQPRWKISPTRLPSAAYPAAERGVSSVRRSGRGHHLGVAPVRAVAASSASLQVTAWSSAIRADQAVGLRLLEDGAAGPTAPRAEPVGEVAHQDRRSAIGGRRRADQGAAASPDGGAAILMRDLTDGLGASGAVGPAAPSRGGGPTA